MDNKKLPQFRSFLDCQFLEFYMKNRHLKTEVLFLGLTLTLGLVGCTGASGQPASTRVPDGYKLVWSDEFDGQGLPNSKKWQFDTRANKALWWHNERQYYARGRTENTRLENGSLIVEVRKEALSNEGDWAGQEYSSARLITEGHASWKYGYFDIRAKLPCGRGVWPAFWLLSDGGSWPKDGEIDIMEHVGHEPNKVHSTLHTYDTEHGGPKLSEATYAADVCGQFHNYQMDWRADTISFFVDDRLVYTAQKPKNGSYDSWPFDHRFYLLINVAVGGAWGNAQGIDPQAFPTRMEVDYVRVYQAK